MRAAKAAAQWLVLAAICAAGWEAIKAPAAASPGWTAPHQAVVSFILRDPS